MNNWTGSEGAESAEELEKFKWDDVNTEQNF